MLTHSLSLVYLAAASSPKTKFDLFDEWKKAFNREYASIEEETRKFLIFEQNLKKINALNNEKSDGAQYSHLSPFADWSAEEFKARNTFGKGVVEKNKKSFKEGKMFSVASLGGESDDEPEWDWTDKGAVGPVQNQGQCGSCWAFSATANIEGVAFMKGLGLQKLSEFEIVECDKTDSACGGGLMENAFGYLADKKLGMVSESDYPYHPTSLIFPWHKRCPSSELKTPHVYVQAWTSVGKLDDTTNSEDALARALVQYGPLAIALNAGPMQFYFGGVSDPSSCDPSELDHGVLLVGYGTDSSSGKDFWKIRNSWGPSWGEKGYYRIARGKGACGMNSHVVTVTDVAAPSANFLEADEAALYV